MFDVDNEQKCIVDNISVTEYNWLIEQLLAVPR